MKKLAIIGNPVTHSLSPIMHNAAFNYLKLKYEYVKINVEYQELSNFIKIAKKEYAGFNVTAPYKHEILKYLDEVSAEVNFSESANTVLIKEEKLYGYSTDGYGFEKAASEAFNITLKEPFFFIGCGGAATSVIAYLLSRGVKKIIISNRTETKIKQFTDKLKAEFPSAEINLCSLYDLKTIQNYLEASPIVVQSTNLGLNENDDLPLNPEILKENTKVFDMIYKETEFLKEARKRNCIVCNGLLMLLYQGVKSFKIWTRLDAPIDIMRKALFQSILKRC